MNPSNAIEVRDVTKFFKVYKDRSHKLRERFIRFRKNEYEKREVLKGITFDIKKGESVALIGRNGCGKSTTLKMLARILRPNGGSIEQNGRVYSLIELGAGFHADLTGRENVYINASIFGIKAKEVDRRIDDIIRFSELEEFIDNPVRTYSSGMYMRLAFSVAINVDADILLVDEILAVGDSAFQTKCFNKLQSLKEEGITIILVSHSTSQVEALCNRAIWLEDGEIREDGNARRVCRHYLDTTEEGRRARAELEYRQQLAREREREEREQREREKKERELERRRQAREQRRKEEEEREKRKLYLSCREICPQCGPDARRSGSGEARFTRIQMLNAEGQESLAFATGDKVTVHFEYELLEDVRANIVIGITRDDWVYCYGAQTGELSKDYHLQQEAGELSFVIDALSLLDGKYFFDCWIVGNKQKEYDVIHSILEFEVKNPKEDMPRDYGIFSLPHHWV